MSDGISDDRPGLFGWVPAPPRDPGRPPFAWSREKSNKVMVLLASGHTLKTVAGTIGCDVKTLRKVFPRECAVRDKALLIMRSGMMAQLVGEGEKGNVGAIKTLDKMLDAERVRATGAAVKDRGMPAAKLEKVGKKQAAKDAAKGLRGRFETRTPPPGLMTH